MLIVLPERLKTELLALPPGNVATLDSGEPRGEDAVQRPPGDFYPTRPATQAMEDGNPAVEAVRWSKSEAELVQAVGRG
jgi:hypothetical protein